MAQPGKGRNSHFDLCRRLAAGGLGVTPGAAIATSAGPHHDPVTQESRMSQNERQQGRQKGAQQHAEGQHGEAAHERLIEELESGAPRREAGDRSSHEGAPGKHRLFEGREQHDEADQNSDRNRLEKDIGDHGHDREQLRGAARTRTNGTD
jgi:hypothetical protein